MRGLGVPARLANRPSDATGLPRAGHVHLQLLVIMQITYLKRAIGMIIRNAKEMTESVDLFGGFLEAEERWIPRTQDSNQYDNTCNQTEVKNLAID